MGRLNRAKRNVIPFLVLIVSCVAHVTVTACAVLSPAKPQAAVAPTAATLSQAPQASESSNRRPNNPVQPLAQPERVKLTVARPPVRAKAQNSLDAGLLGPTIVNNAAKPRQPAVNADPGSPEAVPERNIVTALQQDASPEVDRTSDTAPAALATQTDSPSPMQYTDLWDRIRGGFRLPQLDGPRVDYHERWFANNPKYMQRKLKRARLYLYHIVEEVQRRGMPTEIALLPAIESAYHPHAYSRARAVGLWQFIGPTARHYGLKMNWWYDGRRDIVASTTAALNYLEKLYEDFDGNWHLALAAYNAGEGKIKWAIEYNRRKGLPTDYPSLRLRRETRHYLPKLMAMVNIVSDPDQYGIELAPIPNEPYFARVDVGSQIDLKLVAELAHLPVGDFFDINPGFRRWATDPNGPHQVLVPVDRKERLLEGLNNLPEYSRIKWRRHRVKRGDTLSTIARRYGVSVWVIKKANNLRGSLIRIGWSLMIPISSRPLSKQTANITRPLPRTGARPRGRTKIIHRVRKGESLWSIARKYRVYVHQLARWNYMHPRDILRAGRQLKVWIYPDRVPSI